MNGLRSSLMLGLLLLALTHPASAHRLLPSLLEAHEQNSEQVVLTWTTPAITTPGFSLEPLVPHSCQTFTQPTVQRVNNAHVMRWTMRCPQGLAGQRFGVNATISRGMQVILRVTLSNGQQHRAVMTTDHPYYDVPEKASIENLSWDYFRLGTEHILTGWDHLAFVLGLLLLVGMHRSLIWPISAFTMGHSITLALAVLGWIQVPTAWVEAAIALSILLVAVEAAQKHHAYKTWFARMPWLSAAIFGLLHGLGFSAALGEIGLPRSEIPLALLFFNLGIEAGQLLFIAAALSTAWLLIRSWKKPPAWLSRIPIYLIGGLSAYWLIQRVAAAL